jgi:hypothetical protein
LAHATARSLASSRLSRAEFFTKVQVGAMTGYAHSSGSFSNALSNLYQTWADLAEWASIALNPEADVSGLVDQTPASPGRLGSKARGM